MKIICVFVLGLSAACASNGDPPVGPTAEQLYVVAEATAVPVGGRTQLRALLRGRARTDQTVHARWSSTDDKIASVTQDGTVTGVTIGAATVIAEYERFVSQLSINVVAELAGTWVGDATITGCGRRAGEGPSACRFLLGIVQRVQLQISQSGDRVSGKMLLGRNNEGTLDGTVSGEVLTCKVALISEEDEGTLTADEWQLTRTEAGLVTNGVVRIDEKSTNAFGPQNLVLTYSVSTLRRN